MRRVLRLFYSTPATRQIAPPPSLRFFQKRHSDQSQSLDPATGPKIWHHLPRRFKQQHQQHRRRWGLSKPPARHGRQFHSQGTWGARPLARRPFRVFFSCPLGHASDRPPKEIHTFKLPPTQRRASSSRHPPHLRTTTRAPRTASHWALARRFPIDSQLSHPAALLSAVRTRPHLTVAVGAPRTPPRFLSQRLAALAPAPTPGRHPPFPSHPICPSICSKLL